MIELLPWEVYLREFALGSLIVGLIFFFFSLITSVLGQVDHDHEIAGHDVGGDVDFDVDVDTGLDLDVDTGLDLDVDTGLDLDIDAGLDLDVDTGIDMDASSFDVDHDLDVDHGVEGIHDTSPAPLMLLVSTFFLSFGILGTSFYNTEMDSIIRLLLLIVIPIAFVKGTSLIWRKILIKEEAYEIPRVKIDNQIKTLTRVDEKGGLVLADTSDVDRAEEQLHLLGHIKMQAKTLPGVVFERNEIGYVIAKEKNNTLIIDRWPKPAHKS
ncbi:MAG: hypothetical protein ACXAC7_00770 [Candidatus Hodarchaeales archaeon]